MALEDKRLERMEAKLDDISEHLGGIDITLAAQHVSLKEHIRRTALLEKELAPIQKHVNMLQGIIKFIGILAGLAAVIELIGRLK